MRRKEKIAACLVIAHILNALLYLQFPAELKYSEQYEDLFALWFFGGEYAFICAISYFKPRGFVRDLFISHVGARAILYVLYFSDISSDNIIIRLGFILTFLLIFTLGKHIKYFRDVERSFN